MVTLSPEIRATNSSKQCDAVSSSVGTAHQSSAQGSYWPLTLLGML